MKTYWRSALFRAIFGMPLGVTVGLLLILRHDLLTRSTVCHLLITLAGFCALGLIQRWLVHVPAWMLIVFIAVYFFIWLIQWGICYQRVRCMNNALRRRRSKSV